MKARNAVRVYIIKDNKVVAIQYKQPNRRAGYYDIPGGKIEEGETKEEAVIRECEEEIKMKVKDLKEKGTMDIQYPDRRYHFTIYSK